MKPVLLVIGGPNGVGGTTHHDAAPRAHRGDGVEYLNPDDVARERFGDWNASGAVLDAVRWTTARREELLGERAGIAFETVLPAPDTIDFIQRAKDAGYFVRVLRGYARVACEGGRRAISALLDSRHVLRDAHRPPPPRHGDAA